MTGRHVTASVLGVVLTVVALLTGCSTMISGTPSWPGARLQRVVLTAADFPPGVRYDRIVEQPGQPDGAGGPAAMLSKPAGCSNGLTQVIAGSAERGPGSAAKYSVTYDGARILMTVLTWPLPLDQLAATASRCEHFNAYFDPTSEGIPITTTKLPAAGGDSLVYQQTMRLHGAESSVFMSFQNIDRTAVFGIAFPTKQMTTEPPLPPKASLPQTFLDIVHQQADRVRAS
jgi:hypothetical protein